MRYNIIAWGWNKKYTEMIMICDTWAFPLPKKDLTLTEAMFLQTAIETLKDAMETKPRATRAIIIDWKTGKIIYEAKTLPKGYFIDNCQKKKKTRTEYKYTTT